MSDDVLKDRVKQMLQNEYSYSMTAPFPSIEWTDVPNSNNYRLGSNF